MANKEKMKWLLLLMLTALSLWIVLPDHILHMRKPLATDKKKITLGLDLAGGLRYVLEVDQSKLEGRTTAKDAQGRAIEVIRNRIDSMGVAEPNIQAEGDDRVIVELPGLQAKDRDRAIAVIQGVAFLEFRMVHPKNSELIRQLFERNQVPDGYSVVSVADPGEGGHYRGGDYYRRDPSKSSTNDEAAIREAAATFHAPPGYELLLEKHSINGQTLYEPYFVSKTAEIKGDNLKSAGYEYDTMNRPYVTLQLNKPADRKFWNLTKRFSARGSENENPNLPRYLAIVLDGNVISAPHLEDEIPNGQAIIRGNFTFAEAQDLSLVLRSGALPARVKVIEERQVEPSLGADSIAAGKRATMIGCLAVIIFMAGYYFLAGMVANFALIWNVMLLPVTLLIVGAILGMPDPAAASGAINLPTLTLPGIAGIVLTIGMAVDANVLIYERIREEQHLGKDLKSVLQAGYHKAFSAIFDSHVTTIVSAFILFWLGSGAIRGFAVMLAAGIALSLYTSLVVTRMVFNLIQEHTGLKSIKMLELFKNVPHINFIGAWKICAIVSTVVIIGSWAMTLHQGKKVLGVEFTGGTSLSFQFKQEVKVDLIRNTVAAAGIKDAVIQYQTEATTKAGMANKHLQINTGFEESEKTVNAILGTFKAEGYELVKRDSIGPKMSYELAQHAIFAVGIALLLMAVYIGIRFEFPYAIGAIMSLLHDVLVAVGVYCALGEQLSLNIVAAVLTIIGYSINDTIVVFDRIRENVKLARGKSYREIANEAINLSLGRTILTTSVTMLSVLALFIFGGGSLRDLTLCLLIGMTTGVYSTVYVATPFVLLFHREKKVTSI